MMIKYIFNILQEGNV